MNILIIGTGGVGGYFGGKLAHARNQVTFVARGKHLEAIRENGLIVKSLKGDFKIHPANVTENISATGSPDLIILGIKAWQVKDLVKEIKPLLHHETIILPLQNGVMAGEELSQILGKKHVLGGLCRIFSKIEAPGVISHFGVEPEIVFGELDNRKTARIKHLREVFLKSDIKATIPEDIQTELWKKLMIIGSGGLLALTRSSYGGVRENPESRELMRKLLMEIHAVANKAGAHIEPGFVEKTMNYIDSYPYDSTTSLARDIWAEKPSEIEYQNGTISHFGEKFGIETPVNKFVYHCLLPMERRARGKKEA